MPSKIITAMAFVVTLTAFGSVRADTQEQAAATFRSSVDLVRVSAVVRDRKGRFVQDLSLRDFEVFDDGRSRAITDFRTDFAGLSVAMLFDVSGSMEAKLPNAREAAGHVLSWLDAEKDEAAIFTFDTRLDQVIGFTSGLRRLPESMSAVVPFGATSLHDAIALTAQRVVQREGRRRAVIVFTDGGENASRLSASDASGIASRIDVPVYIFGIVPSIDNPSADNATSADRSPFAGRLSDLSMWTGGPDVIV